MAVIFLLFHRRTLLLDMIAHVNVAKLLAELSSNSQSQQEDT